MLRSSLLLAFLSACAVARAQEAPADAGPGSADAEEPATEEAATEVTEREPAAPEDAATEVAEREPAAREDAGPLASDEPAPEDAPAPPPMRVTEVPPDDDGLALAFGVRGGYALQPDQYVAGPHFRLRGILADFVELDAMVLAGMATEHWTLRVSAHLKLIISAGDFRFFPLLGPAGFIYQPRGQFADWCDKLDLECSSSAFGMELGLGAGWRALGLEAYLSTGELPLLTILGSVTLEL